MNHEGPKIGRRSFLRGIFATLITPEPVANLAKMTISSKSAGAVAIPPIISRSIGELGRILSWISHKNAGLRSAANPERRAASFANLIQRIADFPEDQGTTAVAEFRKTLKAAMSPACQSQLGILAKQVNSFMSEVGDINTELATNPKNQHIIRWLKMIKEDRLDAVIEDPLRMSLHRYQEYLHQRLSLSDAEVAHAKKQIVDSGLDPTICEQHVDSLHHETLSNFRSALSEIENHLLSDRSRSCMPIPSKLIRELALSSTLSEQYFSPSTLKTVFRCCESPRTRAYFLSVEPRIAEMLLHAKETLSSHEEEIKLLDQYPDLLC